MDRLTQPLHSGFSSPHCVTQSEDQFELQPNAKQDRRTLILRFLQLVQPALDLLCDRRSFGNVAGISSYTREWVCVERLEVRKQEAGKHEIRNTQYASIDCGYSSSVRPPPPAEPNSAFLLTVITGYLRIFCSSRSHIPIPVPVPML